MAGERARMSAGSRASCTRKARLISTRRPPLTNGRSRIASPSYRGRTGSQKMKAGIVYTNPAEFHLQADWFISISVGARGLVGAQSWARI